MDDETLDAPIEARLVEPDAAPSNPHSPIPYSPVSQSNQFLQNKWAVLAILFAVTGFLGIPLLWTNKQFTSAERIFWSIVVTIYTIGLIAGAAAIVMWSYRQIMGG